MGLRGLRQHRPRGRRLSSAQPGQPELVVYDTRTLESVHQSLDVAPGSYALLASVTERFAYWYDNSATVEDECPSPRLVLDLATGAQEPVAGSASSRQSRSGDPTQHDGEPRRGRRTAVPGHRRQRVAVAVQGGRVEPQGMQPLDARDGGSRKRFAFDAPAGYPNTNPIWLTQWLDDDTVVRWSRPARARTTCSSATSPPERVSWPLKRRRWRSCSGSA